MKKYRKCGKNNMLTNDMLIKLQEALDSRGVKDYKGDLVPRLAFMKKKHIKRVKWQRQYKLKDGRNFYIRVFK